MAANAPHATKAETTNVFFIIFRLIETPWLTPEQIDQRRAASVYRSAAYTVHPGRK
jgi:hypothetical protein